jgi:hypothetical protein
MKQHVTDLLKAAFGYKPMETFDATPTRNREVSLPRLPVGHGVRLSVL